MSHKSALCTLYSESLLQVPYLFTYSHCIVVRHIELTHQKSHYTDTICTLLVYHRMLIHLHSPQIPRLLGIGSEKLVLLDNKTKLLLHTHPLSDLQEWRTGSGRGHDGLVLEFRASKPWNLSAPSVDNLKSVTAALWDVMGLDNRFLENSNFPRDMLDFGKLSQSHP